MTALRLLALAALLAAAPLFAPPAGAASPTLGQASVGMPWRGALPASGSYTVQVYQMRASGRRGETAPFTLTVGVH